MVENNIVTANTEERKKLQIFEINLLILIAVTMGVFGLINSYWMASIVWLSFLVLFGSVWTIDCKDSNSISYCSNTKIINIPWRLLYIFCLISNFVLYNYSFWWWAGFGDINNIIAFNADAAFAAFCITIDALLVFEIALYLSKNKTKKDLLGILRSNKEVFIIVGLVFLELFFLGAYFTKHEPAFIADNVLIPFVVFLLIIFLLRKKLQDKNWNKIILIIFSLFSLGFAVKSGGEALNSKINYAYTSKDTKILSNMWFKDEKGKNYFFIHARWNDSVYFNPEENKFYKCLSNNDSIKNCQIIAGIFNGQLD